MITTATALGETHGAAELALQLFLAAAGAACEVPGLEDIAYELFEQVWSCYQLMMWSLHCFQHIQSCSGGQKRQRTHVHRVLVSSNTSHVYPAAIPCQSWPRLQPDQPCCAGSAAVRGGHHRLRSSACGAGSHDGSLAAGQAAWRGKSLACGQGHSVRSAPAAASRPVPRSAGLLPHALAGEACLYVRCHASCLPQRFDRCQSMLAFTRILLSFTRDLLHRRAAESQADALCTSLHAGHEKPACTWNAWELSSVLVCRCRQHQQKTQSLQGQMQPSQQQSLQPMATGLSLLRQRHQPQTSLQGMLRLHWCRTQTRS